MNVKLLKQVRDYIAKHPERYNQSKWCGTECCVAGTAAFLSGKVTSRKVRAADPMSTWANTEIRDIARRALRITQREADRLFSAGWAHLPERYRVRREMEPTERAGRAYDRINRFIETKGAE